MRKWDNASTIAVSVSEERRESSLQFLVNCGVRKAHRNYYVDKKNYEVSSHLYFWREKPPI